MTGRLSGHKPVAKTTDWLTPPEIIDALGPFDLDPCVCDPMPWRTAAQQWTKRKNGLTTPWPKMAFVWMNPPYGREADAWLKKLHLHNHGIALTFCRTETQTWHKYVWYHAEAILFCKGRLHFHYPDGTRAEANAGAGSALIGYGPLARKRLLSREAREAIPGRRLVLKEEH
jgi:hypothetical protein